MIVIIKYIKKKLIRSIHAHAWLEAKTMFWSEYVYVYLRTLHVLSHVITVSNSMSTCN
jgi:hypothetical protein